MGNAFRAFSPLSVMSVHFEKGVLGVGKGKKRNRQRRRRSQGRPATQPRRKRRDWRMITFYTLGILIVLSMALSLIFPLLAQ